VKSFASLLAELALPHKACQHVVGYGCKPKLLAHAVCDIEADQIHQLQRSHGHTEFQCSLIDLLAWLAELVAADRLHQVWRKHAVHEEARAALHHQRQFVDSGHEGARLAYLVFARPLPAHYLDERKLRYGIEEMQSDQAAGIGEWLGDVLKLER